LAIGTSQAFIITLPLDFSGGKKAMNSRIYWELSNYFPDNYNEFVVNTYRLNNAMPCKDTDEFLIIAVHKHTLEFIKRIFKICALNLKLIDIDHFSAENSLRMSYEKQIAGKRVLMAGVKKNRVDYGIIESRKYKTYTYSTSSSETEFNLSIVKKLGHIFEQNIKGPEIDTIYLYGDSIDESTIESIRKLGKAQIEIMDPFNGINAAALLLQDESLRKNSYKFASSCGAALRSMKQN
jgi:Tfp pilus assembly PilM family ATPase